jgi:polyribonucleotide nucleotidyltransferase
MVLGTANRSDPRPGLDFFPLTVEFEERMYAAGKIPGGFIKRESRPSEQAILACRLTDRPIRPLFPEGYKDDIQIVITVLSTDQENQTDVLGTFAASCALTISDPVRARSAPCASAASTASSSSTPRSATSSAPTSTSSSRAPATRS